MRNDAKLDGAVAGRTRKDIEEQVGTKVISEENFLQNNKNKLEDLSGSGK